MKKQINKPIKIKLKDGKTVLIYISRKTLRRIFNDLDDCYNWCDYLTQTCLNVQNNPRYNNQKVIVLHFPNLSKC